MPRVTIVLPSYNGEKYINESIDSIIDQTFLDWELIIVNDCSTDATLKTIKKYEKCDSRIKVISNPKNEKLPESLNIGFRTAQGDYLTWTSDDNMYLPTAIEEMVDYLDEHTDEIMVCTGMNWVDENKNFIQKHIKYSNSDMMLNDCVGASFMYRREVLNTVGEYDSDMVLVEDYDYWLRILFRYGNIAYIDKVLYIYRSHAESLTQTRQNEIHNNLLKLKEKYLSKLVQHLENQKENLCELYYDFKFHGIRNDQIDKKICTLVPEICIDSAVLDSRKKIVYGAGKYGEKAYEFWGSEIKYYADKNQNLVGTEKNGIKIISIDKMINLQNRYQIIVAAHISNIYDFLITLKKSGCNECCVFVPQN